MSQGGYQTGSNTLDEITAREVLLVHAFEEEDREGRLLTRTERKQASELAEDQRERSAIAFIAKRAKWLRHVLEERFSTVATVLRVAGTGRLVGLGLVLLALIAGLAVDQLGARKHINVLSVPLLGLIAWNFLAYLANAVFVFLRSPVPWLPGLVANLSRWLATPRAWWMREKKGRDRVLLSGCLRRYVSSWMKIGAPLHIERAKLTLHLAALTFAIGAVAGMYLRGIAFEYEATWESTFLDANGVFGILKTILGPAALLTGREIPSPAYLEQHLHFPATDHAASWIHLYAVTMGIFVGLPRLVFAGLSFWKARRLSKALPLPLEGDASFLRLSSEVRGGGMHVVVLPYSIPSSSRNWQNLHLLLSDLLGTRAQVEFREALEYGDDPPTDWKGGEFGVVVFNLAQSPEEEVHTAFIDELKKKGPLQVLILLDESSFRATLGEGDAATERLDERRKNWEMALAETGKRPLSLDLSRPAFDQDLVRAREALGR